MIGVKQKGAISRAYNGDGRRLVLVAVASLILIACASPPIDRGDAAGTTKALLEAHYRQWRGVKHRLGGTDRRGIDCSAFVHLTYKTLFQHDLPRTTRAQSKVGQPVARDRLRPGDLVFFKAGGWRHVGVYSGDGQFIHASASRGVIRSGLESRYWSRRYWQARRPR